MAKKKPFHTEVRVIVELVEDWEIYPRSISKVDPVVVADYAHKEANGVKFPPILIFADGRILDGFHRKGAKVRTHGPNHRTTCDVWDGPIEEGFLEAVRRNGVHGLHNTPSDRVRISIIGVRLGLTTPDIAAALGMTSEKLETLREAKTAQSSVTSEHVPVKPALRHLAGTKLTKMDELINREAGGNTLGFSIKQIWSIIGGDNTLDTSKPGLLEALCGLADRINDKVRPLLG